MTRYHARELTTRLKVAMKRLPVVVVSGLRQSGKSTLLQNERNFVSGHDYQTFDDFSTLAAAKQFPESLIEKPVILDEVQRCPEILLTLKKHIDVTRDPGKFILSGSANLALIGHVTESLAGRAGYYVLHPMTRRECSGNVQEEPFLTRFLKHPALPSDTFEPVQASEILRGGLPPACLGSDEGLGEWFRGYVQTYVERDVRQMSRITDLVSFQMLAKLAAMRTSQVLVQSTLARDAKLKAATAKRYLDLLETSFLIRKLPPYLGNRTSRLVKSPKLHFTDSGLAAHMAGMTHFEPGADALLRGALFETYVGQNLSALLEAHQPEASMSYWHEQGRHEVDMVIESGKKVLAIEVKAASRWSDKDLASLRVFLDRTPQCIAAVLAYNGEKPAQLGERLFCIPMGLLLS